MHLPSERTGWIAVGLAVVAAVGLGAWGVAAGETWPFVAAGLVGGAALGGAAGYLAVVGRSAEELRGALDYRLALPAAGLFVLAGLAVVVDVATEATVAGHEPTLLAGVGFAGAFVLFGIESWLADGRRLEAVGEVTMAAGWLLLFLPGLAVSFSLGAVLLLAGAGIALAFGPVGEEVGSRLGLGV